MKLVADGNSWIAALGAFATIMATLTGFISQQLVQFEKCLRPDTNVTVEVFRANSFDKVGDRWPIRVDTYAPMAVAMEVGILQPVDDLTNTLSRNCATGNCTFASIEGETFSTLGIGHTCSDVTSQLERHYEKNISQPPGESWTWRPIINDTTRRIYNLTLPLTYDQNLTYYMGQIALDLVVGVTYGGRMANDSNAPLGTVKIIYRPYTHLNETGKLRYAFSCSLFPTVNTYAVRITKSVLEETLVRSIRVGRNIKDYAPTGQLTPWTLGTTRTIWNGTRIDCERRSEAAPGLLPVSYGNIDRTPRDDELGRWDDEGPDSELKRLWYMPEKCVWTSHDNPMLGINTYLRHLFHDQTRGHVVDTDSMHLRQLYQNKRHPRNLTLQSVDKVMTELARSMSTVVRTHGGVDDSYPAPGIMMYATTCIRIGWPWIAFPAAMIGLSCVFLILVHLESRHTESERLWKSSVLAMLFCEADSDLATSVQPLHKRTLAGVAKSTSVQLDKGKENLKFRPA